MSANPGSPPTLYGIDLGIPLNERRVLIADDSSFNRKTLARFLTWAGITQVEFAQQSEEVLARVDEFHPDLVLLDTTPPRMDGIGVCKSLRQQPHHRDLPILMQSAVNSDQHRTICFQAGATDIISKPVNPGECIARVRYHLERMSLIQELREFRERVERDLRMARSMQLALVPEEDKILEIARPRALDIEMHFRSSDEVGGDFWTLFEIDDTKIGLFIADLSGHGITAAINAFRLHTLMSRLPSAELLDPAALLAQLNRRLNDILTIGQYATAFYGVLDTRTDCLTYASAGSPDPILGRHDGMMAVDASGVFLGAFAGETYENRHVAVPPGSFLFLYSDALTESLDQEGEMLGEKGLLAWIKDVHASGVDRPLDALLERHAARYGTHLHDDLTTVWLQRH